MMHQTLGATPRCAFRTVAPESDDSLLLSIVVTVSARLPGLERLICDFQDCFRFADNSTRNPFFGSENAISFWKLRSFGWAGFLFIDAA
jgi:hypothetical protein